jgi:uncharacterized protein YndB with AHSA1/START domain
MTELGTLDAYGVLTEPATLRLERLLPGPIERIWSYLTESNLRRQWLAAGRMEMKVGAPFEFVWHNDELTNPPGRKPEGFGSEFRMKGHVTEVDPPRKLAFTWGEGEKGGVSIELAQKGKEVLLTLIHRRIPDRESLLSVSAGWHMHLNILAARMGGREPDPFWDGWNRLHSDYAARFPI